jgi:tRNA(Ile2) C34 agmatinyltransferase TiaS
VPKVGDRYLYEAPDGRMVSRQRIWQIQREAEGACNQCGERKAVRGKKCNRCATVHVAVSNASRLKRMAKHGR